jgi:hypothetical protein
MWNLFKTILGTGKTLMARQIGKMLNCREPKIISGPGKWILDHGMDTSEVLEIHLKQVFTADII